MNFIDTFFIVDSLTISLQIIYHYPHNLASDQEQELSMCLWKFTDYILQCFDDKKVAIAIFMDLSKTFDCVEHEKLLTLIKWHGVHSTALRWISSYPCNREYDVSYYHI